MAAVTVSLVGANWKKVANFLGTDRERFRKEFKKIIRAEGQTWKDMLDNGFRTGNFGGRQQAPIAKSTRFTRVLHRNFSGYRIVSTRKPLVASGTLRDSLQMRDGVDGNGDPAVMVGWFNDQRHTNPGPNAIRSLPALVEIIEKGAPSQSLIYRAKDPGYSFLRTLARSGGLRLEPRGELWAVTVRHRARPFLGPALREARRGIKTRINRAVAEFIRRNLSIPKRK